MSLRDKAQAVFDRALGATPLAAAAELLAKVLDEQQVTAADLDQAAAEGKPLLVLALDTLSDEAKKEAHERGAVAAKAIPRVAYGALIEALSWSHPEHARVLFARRDWTVGQLDAARQWLAHGSKGGA